VLALLHRSGKIANSLRPRQVREVVRVGGIASKEGCGTGMRSANRETGIGIGIMLAAVGVEDITIMLRDVVRVAVTDTGECRPMNMIVREGGGPKILASINFFLWLAQFLSLSSSYQLYHIQFQLIESPHTQYLIVYIDFHSRMLAATTWSLATSGAPVSSSSTDANKASATLPPKWASLPASFAKKSIMANF